MAARFLGAGLRRTMAEAGTVACLLVLPLTFVLRPVLDLAIDLPHGQISEPVDRWPVLGLSMVYVGLLSALLGASRLRRASGRPRRRLAQELGMGAAVVFAIWVGALLAHLAGSLWGGASGVDDPTRARMFGIASPALAGVSAAAATAGYVVARGLVLAWPVWDRLRRAQLVWALTHAQLVAGLTLAVGVALVAQTATGYDIRPPFGPETLPDEAGPAAVFLTWVTTRLLPTVTVLLALCAATALVVLPPAALISYLVLRRTTGRLEALAAAAGTLRSGDLTARVPIGGEDEVARLQASFNAMAGDLERTLRDLEAERDRVAGLLEARRQLVASASHELRTPVATVRGYLESVLGRAAEVPPDLRADLETMESEVARLQGLIEDLFTLSRAAVGRLELHLKPTDAGVVVRRLVETTAPLAWRQRRVEVLAEIAPDLPPARADAQRLAQIVSNLLGNAVRHTPPGGLVAAAVAAEPDVVRVEVRDTGEGIPPDDLPRIFERFYRGRNGDGQGGAGLGLALTRELTEAMGGTVEAASAPGEGSRFTVRLPRA
jgi:signal transduction histidine kinase